MMQTFLSVAAGGAIGATLRFLTNVATLRLFGTGFPWGTVVCNIGGSVLMGWFFVVLTERSQSPWAVFLLTGVLGGYTTFSTFSLDTMNLWAKGMFLQAGGYVFGSVLLSVLGLAAGMALARGMAS